MKLKFHSLAWVLCAACGAQAHPSTSHSSGGGFWVLAPHPDDEALMASHVIARAVREGRDVHVMLMTNGDLGCGRDGWQRERETVAAMAELGLAEEHVRFLGYPDGYLEALSNEPLAPVERLTAAGECVRGSTTYAGYGENHRDVHSSLEGMPGYYVAQSVVFDLVALLERDRPSDIYVSHPVDDHPDHATTYFFLRRALERAHLAELPVVHRALVHAGGCWPNGSGAVEPCPREAQTFGTPYPRLPEPLAPYEPNEHVQVPDHGALGRRAIGHYHSQLHVSNVDGDWLGTFSRGEAIYWAESFERHGERLVRTQPADFEPGQARALGPLRWLTDSEEAEHLIAEQSMVQRLPLDVSFEASVPEHGSARVHVLSREDDRSAGYQIVVLEDEIVEVRRPADRLLRRFLIPRDGRTAGAHRWELRLDVRPDDGGAAELELRRDGSILGIVVDAHPYVSGDRVSHEVAQGARVEQLSVRPVVALDS